MGEHPVKTFKDIPHTTKNIDGYVYVKPSISSTIKITIIALICILLITSVVWFMLKYLKVESYKNYVVKAMFVLWFIVPSSVFLLVNLYRMWFTTPKLLEECFYNIPVRYKEAILKYAREYMSEGWYFEKWGDWDLINLRTGSVKVKNNKEERLLKILLEYGRKYPGALSYVDYQGASGGAFTIDWATAVALSFELPIHYKIK